LPAPEFPACGEVFADCVLRAELGRGALGRVFLATQPLLADRPVVLKVTPLVGAEHLSLARLWHTHIVPLHFTQDFPERGLRVLCMPYLGGATLADVHRAMGHVPCACRTGRDLGEALNRLRPAWAAAEGGPARAALARLSYAEAMCWLGSCLADALHHAHERGVIHLDVKPSNVLLAADGTPMLLDFHLARAPLAAGSGPGEWFGGTTDYMAPEHRQAMAAHAAGRPVPARVDERADVYSLGRALYELLSGDLGGCRPLRECNPAAGPGLSAVIGKCLAADPAARYQQAGDLAADLRRHLAGLPLRGVRERSLGERWRKWRRRRPHALARAGLSAAALLALLVAGLLGLALLAAERRDAERALAGGGELQRLGRYAEAERELAHGLEKVRAVPWAGGLVRELEAARTQARAAKEVQELGQCADALRYLSDLDALGAGAARALDGRCARLWAAREALLAAPALGGGTGEKVRQDLLDLAVLWGAVHVRAAEDEGTATRQALAVLAEAEALLGGGPALEQERRRWRSGDGAATASPARPRTAGEHEALGRALLSAGRAEEAAAELEQAVRLRPQSFWPHFYQGLCAHRRGRYEEAVAAFGTCVALAPRSAPCYANRALTLAALGRAEAALRDYDRALELDSGLTAARLGRGALNLQAGRLADADADFERALAGGADPAAAHFNLALVCQERRAWADCRRHLLLALQARPGHRAARDLLSRLPALR
jgi:tetratricopeptide (TPR) repeat protein